MTEELLIEPADPESGDAVLLIAHLSADIAALYADQDDDGSGSFTPDDVRVPGSVFLVARLDGVPVGCGAVRPLEPGIGEVKRMFVERSARGRGIAGRLLTELEASARAMGYRALRLETGVRQPEAIRVYERGGYRRIERYGKYSHNPLSVCFEKTVCGSRET